MQTTEAITLDFRGTLIGTTDLQRAKNIGRVVGLRGLLHGSPAHYETTPDGTILIYAGAEFYELKGGN